MKSLCFIFLACSWLFSQQTLELWTLAGKRIVQAHGNDTVDYSYVDTGPVPHYAYLVTPNPQDVDAVKDKYGVEILELNQLVHNTRYIIYTVSIPSSFTFIREQMITSNSVFNLVPFLDEEKISPLIVNDTDLDSCHKDLVGGQIYASVGFFKDTPATIRDSLIDLYADSILSEFFIQAFRQDLIDLSRENRVQDVVESFNSEKCPLGVVEIQPDILLDREGGELYDARGKALNSVNTRKLRGMVRIRVPENR